MALEDETAALIERIDYVRDRVAALIEGVDTETIIHPASGWSLRDILAHIAAWQREAIAAGDAYLAGKGDTPLRDIHRFNQEAHEDSRRVSTQEVLDDWRAVYEALKDLVRRAPVDTWAGEFVFPWGERGTVATLVRSILSHDAEHAAEIRAALNRPNPDGPRDYDTG